MRSERKSGQIRTKNYDVQAKHKFEWTNMGQIDGQAIWNQFRPRFWISRYNKRRLYRTSFWDTSVQAYNTLSHKYRVRSRKRRISNVWSTGFVIITIMLMLEASIEKRLVWVSYKHSMCRMLCVVSRYWRDNSKQIVWYILRNFGSQIKLYFVQRIFFFSNYGKL